VPRSKQLGKQPDEAMSSSRGDARAAKRARTGGAKTAPRQDQRVCLKNKISASYGRFLGTVFETQEPPNSFVWQIYLGRLLNKRTGSAAEPLKLASALLPTSGK
jgi:hypothetical protein